jgi:hypothetical protein
MFLFILFYFFSLNMLILDLLDEDKLVSWK